MSEQTLDLPEAQDGEAPEEKGTSTYVVQVQRTITYAGDTEGRQTLEAWEDIATVTVPHRSPRKRVIGEALATSGLRPALDSMPLQVRVLDAASFAKTELAPFQPEAEWKIS